MRGFVFGLFTLVVFAPAASATDGSIAYLRAEPVTLLDWGLIRLEADLDDAGAQGVDGVGAGERRAGAYYDRRQGTIVAYLTLATRYDLRTAENCRAAYRRIVNHLARGAPSGVGAGVWYLESVFGHVGVRGARRPSDLGEQLVKQVQFEVALRASERDHKAGDWMRVSCAGRMDTAQADIETQLSGAIQ